MANEIEYGIGKYPNYKDLSWSQCGDWSTCHTPPKDLDYLRFIRLDHVGTEDVGEITDEQAEKRWEILAPGCDLPDDCGLLTAVAYAEAIWLDTIWHNVTGHARVINSFFCSALKQAAGGYDWYMGDYEEVTYNGTRIDFSIFEQIAHDAGVDIRIKAWLDGVPLEYVIAE